MKNKHMNQTTYRIINKNTDKMFKTDSLDEIRTWLLGRKISELIFIKEGPSGVKCVDNVNSCGVIEIAEILEAA